MTVSFESRDLMEWKPIAETRKELEALGETKVDVLWQDGDINTWEAINIARHPQIDIRAVYWTIIPRPTHTLAELERAVVEAAVRVEYHLDSGLTHAVIALRRARENAAEGGGA